MSQEQKSDVPDSQGTPETAVPDRSHCTGPRGGALNDLGEVFRAQYYRIADCVLQELSDSQPFVRDLAPGNRTDILNAAVNAFKQRLVANNLPLHFDLQSSIRDEVRAVLEHGSYVPHNGEKTESGKKAPSNEDQLQRNRKLVEAVDFAKRSPQFRRQVLDFIRVTFKSHFPVEMFNDEKSEVQMAMSPDLQHDELNSDARPAANAKPENVTVTGRQINDLVDNFLLWTLLNDPRFDDSHRLVVYLYIFEGLDAQAACEKVRGFEKKDSKKAKKQARIKEEAAAQKERREVNPQAWEKVKVDYGLPPEIFEQRYKEVADVFESDGPAMLQRFLSEAKFNESKSRGLIPNYDDIVAGRDRAIKKQLPSQVGAEFMFYVEKRGIQIPQTELQKCLDNIILMLLQRGNITARNFMLVRLARMFGSFARGNYAKYKLDKYGGTSADWQDLEQALAEKAIGNLAGTDPGRGRVSTHVGWWTQNVVNEFCYRLEPVRRPLHVHDQVNRMRRGYQGLQPGEDGKHKSNPQKPTVTELIERGLIRVGKGSWVSIDEPVDSEDGKPAKRGDFMPELAFDPEDELDEQTIVMLNRALDCLPPRDAYLIKQRIFEERTLEEVGKELGVSRQRVYQLQVSILEGFKDMAGPTPTGKSMVVINEALLRQWCEREIKSDALRECFYFRWGVSGADGDLQAATVVETGCSNSSLRKEMTRLKHRLLRSVARLPKAERFVLYVKNAEIYERARAVLQQLEKVSGVPQSEIVDSIRGMLGKTDEKEQEQPQTAEAGVAVEGAAEPAPAN